MGEGKGQREKCEREKDKVGEIEKGEIEQAEGVREEVRCITTGRI